MARGSLTRDASRDVWRRSRAQLYVEAMVVVAIIVLAVVSSATFP